MRPTVPPDESWRGHFALLLALDSQPLCKGGHRGTPRLPSVRPISQNLRPEKLLSFSTISASIKVKGGRIGAFLGLL